MIDRMTEPTVDGRHPEFPHLVFVECEPHYGSYIVRSPACPEGDALLNIGDIMTMLDSQYDESDSEQFGYVSDDYLCMFTTT